ncbi:MAG: hypothetical protein JWR80_1402 [Bradyrhizobium sp.]|nr:hypothetical protein [Bradyrhizobium sp.]
MRWESVRLTVKAQFWVSFMKRRDSTMAREIKPELLGES